ncbi:hypothetical protein BY996DRAFT_6577063 [Phakopsora pachyrhizi]|nr:hypothetical protein BY996DRAFT_6577063 [Phakopsora pachyrhizi]
MSKSSPSVQSRIPITDSPQEIQSKITLAVAYSKKAQYQCSTNLSLPTTSHPISK